MPGDVPIEVMGRLERPAIMDWDRNHLVMRHVDLAKVVIEDALRIRPLAAGRPLVEAVGGPLIYALEEQDRKAIFIGFDLFKTDFPLRVAFPLILSNSLRWLHPSGADQASLQFAAGQPVLLPVPHGGRLGHRDHAERAERQGADHPRHGELQRDRGGRRLLAVDAEGRDEDRRQSDGRGRVGSHPSSASRLGPRGGGDDDARARAEGAVADVRARRSRASARRGTSLLAAAECGSASAFRRRASTAGPWLSAGALVVVLAVTFLRPTLPRWVDRLNVVFLLDASDSVSLAARERAYRFVAEAAKHARSGRSGRA